MIWLIVLALMFSGGHHTYQPPVPAWHEHHEYINGPICLIPEGCNNPNPGVY